jgi:hypothetical protein
MTKLASLYKQLRLALTRGKKSAPFARVFSLLVFFSVFTLAHPAFAWDPWGDITHPERIIRHIGRELGNLGVAINRAWIELTAELGAPATEQWILHSKWEAISAGTHPIPEYIKKDLRCYIDERILQKVQYRVAHGNFFSVATPAFNLRDQYAITLDDVIVFRTLDLVQDRELWVHELMHVYQYERWGVYGFAHRYLRSWSSNEF